MAKCLVLGGNGFLGSHIVDALALQGHTVRAFDRFNSGPVFDAQNVEIISGDFLNHNDLEVALRDIEYVFHFISTTTPITAENDPLIDIETNIRMSVELMQVCVAAGVKRLLFASTGGAIYGLDRDHPLKESELPAPVSPYGIGKLTIEQYLRYFRVKHGLDSVSYRISNPYGERQPLHRKQGVIPIFLERIYNDEPLTVLGDGSMVRDYVYVKDVAAMITQVFDRDHQHDVYNVGSNSGVTVSELVELVQKISGKTAQVNYVDKPPTFVQNIILDTSLFNEEFSVHPSLSLEDGIRQTWSYIEQEHQKSRSDDDQTSV